MRLFISIDFDAETREKILAVQERLRRLGEGNFSREENLHLTLAFLGEQPEAALPAIRAAMDSVSVPRLSLRFSRVGCFRRESELWWIGLDETPALMRLQADLTAALRAAGFAPDAKRFRPHITLAREMSLGRVESCALLPQPFAAAADHISLMLSHRPNGRLTYTELFRRP